MSHQPTNGIPRKHISRVEQERKLVQACREANLSMGPRWVAHVVFMSADSRIGEAWPSMSLIAHEAGCDAKTVEKHVRALQRAGILWTILPPRRASKSGASPEPLRALVALEDGPEGRARPVRNGGVHPIVPPDGRALFLVRPCASQLALERWEADARVIRQWTTDAALAARAGKRLEVVERPANEPRASVATVPSTHAEAQPPAMVRTPIAPDALPIAPKSEERGVDMSRYNRLREEIVARENPSADLTGDEEMVRQCANYLNRRELSDRDIRAIATIDWSLVFPSKNVRVATLALLAGGYDIIEGRRVYGWKGLAQVVDKARQLIEARRHAREAEKEAARRREAEKAAEAAEAAQKQELAYWRTLPVFAGVNLEGPGAYMRAMNHQIKINQQFPLREKIAPDAQPQPPQGFLTQEQIAETSRKFRAELAAMRSEQRGPFPKDGTSGG